MIQLAPFPVVELPDALRGYQRDAIFAVHAHLMDGRRSVLSVSATGTGKTCMALSLARALDARTLWLTHREELIQQTVNAAARWWPECRGVGVVKAQRHETDGQLVVASVQTIARPKRLARMPREFDLVIADEAHHSAAQSWGAVIKGLGAGQPDGPILYGTTATPDRGDGKGLAELFECVAFNYDIAWALEHGHLADIRARAIQIGLDLSDVKSRHGDFVDADLERAMLAVPTPELLVTEWLRSGEGRKTVVFVPTVRLAQMVADAFNRSHVPAAAVWGDMAADDRAATLRRLHMGELRVVTNANVLMEGWDEPSIEAVLWARPTKSRVVYAQGIGRALRTHPGKRDALVLDLVGASALHSLVTAADLLGVHELLEGDTAKKALERKAEAEQREREETAEEQEQSWAEGQRLMFDVDPLQRPKGRRYAWQHCPVRGGQLRWVVAVPDGPLVVVRTNDHPAGHHVNRKGHPWIASLVRPGERPEVLGTGPLKAVLDRAERWLDGNGGRKPGSWRDEDATSKQKWWLRQRGVDARQMTKGQAAAEINRLRAAEDHEALRPVREMAPEVLAVLLNEGQGATAILTALGVPERLHGEAGGIVRRIADVAGDRGLLVRREGVA